VTAKSELKDIYEGDRVLRQGDASLSATFNIVLEKVTKNVEINLNGTIFKRVKHHLTYIFE
jgi:hypothetical protein